MQREPVSGLLPVGKWRGRSWGPGPAGQGERPFYPLRGHDPHPRADRLRQQVRAENIYPYFLLAFFISINVDSRIFYYFIGWGGRADAVVKRLTRRCGNYGGGSAGPFRFAGAPKSSSGAAADTGEVRVAFFRKVLFRLLKSGKWTVRCRSSTW